MTPAQLRRELGHIILRLEELKDVAWDNARNNEFREHDCTIASYIGMAADALRVANHTAGKLLVAQLTDKDRAQADEAGRRA